MTAPTTAPADVLADVLASRHSCRAFLPEPVPGDVMHRMFEIAQQTPSWCNSQAWYVHLVSGEARDALSARLVESVRAGQGEADIPGPEKYEGVYQDRRRASGFALYEAVGIGRKDIEARFEQALENYRFFGAPHLAVITSPVALGTYGVMDCGGYVANLLNAAEALGLGAIAQAAIGMSSDVVRAELDIPTDRSIVCGISIGYADTDHPANSFRTDRADITDAVVGLP